MTKENDNTPDPESGDVERELSKAKGLDIMSRMETREVLGTGEIPAPMPASDVGPQIIGDTERFNPVISDEQLELKRPTLDELEDPLEPEEKGDSRAMWECYLTAEDGAAYVAPGVIHFPVYAEGSDDEPGDGVPQGTIPIEFEGGEVPEGGSYVYADIPVFIREGASTSYLDWTRGGIVLRVYESGPDEVEKLDGSYLVPIAHINRESTTDPETAEEIPATYEITQYLEGSPVVTVDYLDSEISGGTHPFKLIKVDTTTWRIETEGSSIINDDNGNSITIANLGINRTSNGYVYIQCVISSGPVPAGTATVVVSPTAKDEIEVAAGVQTYANLLIGQVYVNLAGNDLDISQAWNNAAILSMMFESGDLMWAFQAHPSHVNSLTAGT